MHTRQTLIYVEVWVLAFLKLPAQFRHFILPCIPGITFKMTLWSSSKRSPTCILTSKDLEEGALKILFFISKSMKAPKRIIQIWFPEDVHPPKWAIERIEKHATKKGFESFIPAQDSSLRYVPYRGKRLYFRRTLNKDDEEDDAKAKAKAKATEYEVRDDDEEDDATNGA
ncbi:hypothetical protein HanXRQr2_Chr17g0831571 [Helianthus annuus]|uniref:Uncharacterized protein n=1 Tax=Helianthus annuus TaxID=4232 RepID=A0A9K3DM77_HELAN|nr:hypothetical protein HanXRQr2_Chr17g0831571 [Helianthus annuus]